jgi:hypothetical protein
MKNSECNRIVLIIGFLFLINCPNGNATTIEVTDNIYADDTWTADTVKILNDISVLSSATLTVSPGTYIEFQGHYKLQVDGRLLAIGNAADRIVFTVNDTTGLYDIETTQGGWNGIDFLATSGDTSKLEYCVLECGKATDGSPDWNNVEDNGGAILCNYNTNPLIVKHCILQNNIAVSAGAVKCHQGIIIFLDNVVKNNKADDGGAISFGYSQGLIASNIITNNTAAYGGILALDNTSGTVVNNILVNNDITDSQGVIYVNPSDVNNRFSFCNNIIAYNAAIGNCGGIFVMYTKGRSPIKNNIIWGNLAQEDNYAIYPDTIINVEYNDIEGGYTGIGNINTDPHFTNPTAGAGTQYDGLLADWSVEANSPCIDKGKPDFTVDSVGMETDFAGNPRILNNRIDMGAFEIAFNPTGIVPHPVGTSDEGIRIFPNPIGNEFNVMTTSGSIITLYNQTGILIESKIATEGVTSFDSGTLPAGVYLVKIEKRHSVSIQKIILK